MLNSDVLDVAIAMVLVYFLLSLLSMTIAELVSRVFALRSSNLVNAIRNLLADPEVASSDLAQAFWSHPLIAKLTQPGRGHGIGQGKDKPSYIPANFFVLALLDVIRAQTQPERALETAGDVQSAINSLPYDELRKLLLVVIGVDPKGLGQVQADLAQWFDDYMDRVSGWYRRKMQLINLGLAIAIVVILNADSLAIVDAVSNNAELRAAAVAVATSYAEKGSPVELSPTQPVTGTQTSVDLVTPVKGIIKLQDTLAELNLPITWAADKGTVPAGDDYVGWTFKAIGLLITALLVSLGAPFWFDMLNKLVNLRSAGTPPQSKAPAQASDSGAIPVPGPVIVPVAEPPPAPQADLDQLADEAVEFVENLKARGRLQSASEEDDAGIQYLKSASARRGLVARAGQIAGAWEAADKPWRVTQ